MSQRPFWNEPAASVLEKVGSSEAGLSAAETGARLKRFGPNEPTPPRRFEALRELGGFLLNPLVLILLVASAVSAAFGQVVSSLIIVCMVLLSVGLNDAPALRSADVGISVDTAVDVARDAADIILLEKRLDVLHDGVVEGRRSFGNIMKYVLMGTSSNFGNMLSMAAASLFLPFLPMLPLQILLNNFLYDLSQVPIPSDRVDATYTLKPKRWNVGFIRRYMLVIGPLSSVYDFLTFAVMLGVFHADERLFRTGWFVESLATQTLVIFVIRTAGRPWQSRPGAGLALGVCVCAAAGAIIPFTPLAPWLGFTPLPPVFFAILVLMVVTYFGLVEVVKCWFYRRYPA